MVKCAAVNKTTVYLPAELQRELSEVARRTGRRQAEIIRTAIEQFLRAQERPVPRSVGAGDDAELSAVDGEDWLRKHLEQRDLRDFGVVARTSKLALFPK